MNADDEANVLKPEHGPMIHVPYISLGQKVHICNVLHCFTSSYFKFTILKLGIL